MREGASSIAGGLREIKSCDQPRGGEKHDSLWPVSTSLLPRRNSEAKNELSTKRQSKKVIKVGVEKPVNAATPWPDTVSKKMITV